MSTVFKLNIVKLETVSIWYLYLDTVDCLEKILSIKTLTEYVGQDILSHPVRINNICEARRENYIDALVRNLKSTTGNMYEVIVKSNLEKVDGYSFFKDIKIKEH